LPVCHENDSYFFLEKPMATLAAPDFGVRLQIK